MIQGWYFHIEFSWLDLAGIFLVIIYNYIHFRGVDPVPKKTEGCSRVRERVSNHGTAVRCLLDWTSSNATAVAFLLGYQETYCNDKFVVHTGCQSVLVFFRRLIEPTHAQQFLLIPKS